MQCPACNVTLVMAERSGVEIDYCPQCRGIWLDRGELDKIIERSEAAGSESPGKHRRGHDDHDVYRSHQGGGGRKSLWRELFD